MIRIAGTNFRLPPAVPSTGYLGGEQPKTVSVQFDGQESEWAYVASDELILARVPQYRGPTNITFPAAQAVRVANLDDSEVEIPGEAVVATDAYSMSRPGLAEESYFQRVVRAFLQLFKRHVIENAAVMSSRDAASENYTDERKASQTPGVYLIGPRTLVNRFDSINREEPEDDTVDVNTWNRKRYPVTLDFEFDLAIYASTQRHLFALCQACVLLFRDITEVRVTDFANQSTPYKDYEIEMMWSFHPSNESVPNQDDLYEATAGVMIRGVHVDDDSGTVIQQGWRITANDELPVIDIQLT